MNRLVIPPEAIAMMEDHDKAYYCWKERHVRSRVLVHIDAHIDFGWVPEMDLDEIGSDGSSLSGLERGKVLLNPFLKPRARMVNIGNYICPAIREGMVSKFYWVIPDKSWASSRGKKHLLKQLKRILRIKRFAGGELREHKGHLSCSLLNTELIVCDLENLPRFEEPVLLDLDLDFLLTERIWDDLDPGRSPWIFPEELYARIAARMGRVEVLTIAYSVEGGFTPLKFKYLGDELRSLFQGDRPETMEHKRKALFLEREDKAAACAAYEEVLKLDGGDASAYYNLALLHLDGGPSGEGKAASFFNAAVARDRSYSTSYNNYGILYLRYNRPERAELEYRRFLRINKNDPAVLNGLGYIALERGSYAQASDLFERCLELNAASPEARSGKAIAFFNLARFAESGELFSGLKKDSPFDPQPCWWLGRIAQKTGRIAEAIDNFKEAVLRGGEGPLVHFKLARLYLIRRSYFRAREELKRGLQGLRTLS